MFVPGLKLASALREALKLDKPVRKIVLTAEVGKPVSIVVEFLADESEEAGLIEAVRRSTSPGS